MQGAYFYCRKHGHDWQYKTYLNNYELYECRICGAKQWGLSKYD